jgi:hypothetical protein
VPVFLASLADSGRVDQRHQLFDVFGHNSIEKRFVPILEGYQENVTLDVGWLLPNVAEDSVYLFVLGVNPWRKQAAQAQCIAFTFRKCGSFVQARIMKNLDSAGESLLFHFQIKEHGQTDRIKIAKASTVK